MICFVVSDIGFSRRGVLALGRLGRLAAAGIETIRETAQPVRDVRLMLRFEKQREETYVLRHRIHFFGQNQNITHRLVILFDNEYQRVAGRGALSEHTAA